MWVWSGIFIFRFLLQFYSSSILHHGDSFSGEGSSGKILCKPEHLTMLPDAKYCSNVPTWERDLPLDTNASKSAQLFTRK